MLPRCLLSAPDLVAIDGAGLRNTTGHDVSGRVSIATKDGPSLGAEATILIYGQWNASLTKTQIRKVPFLVQRTSTRRVLFDINFLYSVGVTRYVTAQLPARRQDGRYPQRRGAEAVSAIR